MSEKLLPCPFCGGEAVLVRDEPTNGWCFIECTCCASHGSMTDKKHAIEAWNTRHERTCKPEEVYLDNYSDLTVTVCSNCHVAIDELEDCYYCPNCGAKVVDE